MAVMQISGRKCLARLISQEPIYLAWGRGLPAWDVAAGQMLALAVLAAERQWRLSGQGQHVKLALSDVAMATAAPDHNGFRRAVHAGVGLHRHD